MILGCIDIGSNTTRLLVADAPEDRLRPLANERVFTQIGKSLRRDGAIPQEKIAETAAVVAEMADRARQAGAERVVAVATAAIRDAPNRAELAKAVEEAGRMPLWVLSSDEEAEMSFVGATRTAPSPPKGRVAVVDVGGGSTEVAVGEAEGGMSWSESYRVGSGILADACLRSDPPTQDELEEARGRAEDALRGLRPPPVDQAVAVGGTATSLRRLVGGDLTDETLARGLEALSSTPIDDAAARLELEPERVRLLPAGILVLGAVAAKLRQPLEIARGGLREGVILELLDRTASG